MTTKGEYNHIEIAADDVDRAKRFYGTVFGWTFEGMADFPDYFLYRAGPGGLGGAIGLRNVSAPSAIRNYITVESIDAAIPLVEANDSSVVHDKAEVPGFGWYAVVNDSEGNEIGLWEMPPSA